jgi:hypothetical protein
MELPPRLMANCHTTESGQGGSTMLNAMVLRGALRAFSTMFGSLGVFCTYLSFLRPAPAVYAVVFIATAMAILWSEPQTGN